LTEHVGQSNVLEIGDLCAASWKKRGGGDGAWGEFA
jgi:hypothetical protein